MKIMVPVLAKGEKQIAVKLQILRELAGQREIGLEFMGSWDDFFDPATVEKIVANAAGLPEDVYLSLHAPFDARKENWGKNFFSSAAGLENFRQIMRLAEKIKARTVTTHVSGFHSFVEMKALQSGDGGKLRQARGDLIRHVQRTLVLIRTEFPAIDVCVENVPYVWSMDTFLNPEAAVYEIAFAEPEDFLQITDKEARIFANIDVCHLAAVLDSSQIVSALRGLSSRLAYVHLSDLAGLWQPFIGVACEGAIPGQGRIGLRVFRESVQYLSYLSRTVDLKMVVEVHDYDHYDPQETRQALLKVIAWLDEAQA